VVLVCIALLPTEVLNEAVVLLNNEKAPKATLSAPVEFVPNE